MKDKKQIKSELIQIKDTKRIKIFHELESGNVIIDLIDDTGAIANRLTIPNANVFSLIRGLVSDRARFHRRKFK